MRASTVAGGVLMIAAAVMTGCAARTNPNVIRWYGTHSLGDHVELRVSTLGMSQIQFELRHTGSGRVFVNDVGTDTNGWFFVWDDHQRLWAHFNDLGTYVWVPDQGRFEKHRVQRGSTFAKHLPPDVRENLPDWSKQSLGVQVAGASSSRR